MVPESTLIFLEEKKLQKFCFIVVIFGEVFFQEIFLIAGKRVFIFSDISTSHRNLILSLNLPCEIQVDRKFVLFSHFTNNE